MARIEYKNTKLIGIRGSLSDAKKLVSQNTWAYKGKDPVTDLHVFSKRQNKRGK